MGFKEDVHKLMHDERWKKDVTLSYKGFRKIIIVQLGYTDRRTISKWLGKNKIVWKKQRGSTFYPTPKKKKGVEWQKGLLEEFFIIKRNYEAEEKHQQQYKEDVILFTILKDRSDF